MMRRTPPALALAALAVAMLATGCTPTPEPTPTPTGFASEEEAFAAAEETYRAYVDALNEVDFADPATFEPMYAYLTGDFLDLAKERYSAAHAEGQITSGDSQIALIEIDPTSDPTFVVLNACFDDSAVQVVDADGNSLVPAERRPVQPVVVRLKAFEDEWLITAVEIRDGEPTCD